MNKGGRPPKYTEEDPNRTVKRSVTLRQRQVDAIRGLQQDEEDFSTTLQRLLDSHPAVVTVMEWIGKH